MTESDILYQNGGYWVCKHAKGWYEVIRDTITNGEVCASIGEGQAPNLGLIRAIAHCNYLAMEEINIKAIEKMLEGKISKNPKRFEAANGIIFMLHNTTEDIREYFNSRGVEFDELNNGIYYTETIMTVVEFGRLNYISHVKKVA